MSETIFALATPPGRAALAVVRISGPASHEAGKHLGADKLQPRKAAVRRLSHPQSGQALDEALVLRFDAPHSATGEDVMELHLHGGRAVVAGVLEAIGRIPGLRPAEPGEFTRRAFENGRLDLTAAEGLADLIDAETAAQRDQAFRQFDGALAQRYDTWRAALIEAMALVEAGIDFSDEADVAADAYAAANQRIVDLERDITVHLAAANHGEIIRSGFQVVLAGPPNAGKSSLLNALAARDVAIVSPEAGTTRDIIEVRMDLGGLPIVVSDTAGLRDGAGGIEREGIRRACQRMAEAGLVIWLVDPLAPKPWPEVWLGETRGFKSPVIMVLNKIDLISEKISQNLNCEFGVSAKTGAGVAELVDAIVEKAHDALADGAEAPPTAPRHRAHLQSALESVRAFLRGDSEQTELRAEDLRLAANEFARLTGRIDPEDVLDVIFGRFCIGK